MTGEAEKATARQAHLLAALTVATEITGELGRAVVCERDHEDGTEKENIIRLFTTRANRLAIQLSHQLTGIP